MGQVSIKSGKECLELFYLTVNRLPHKHWNHTGGVMFSVLDLSVVDCGFKPRSGQTKYHQIGICYFSAKHAGLRTKDSE